MNRQNVFCPNEDCKARGKIGEGNIVIHSRTQQRYKCKVCRRTFSESKGTVYYRKQLPLLLTTVITLIEYGCPVTAVVQAYGLDARTVYSWIEQAGLHAQMVHEELVQVPQQLEHVQADEIFTKVLKKKLWLAMAIAVPTRLWLGAVLSEKRDSKLIKRLAMMIRNSCVWQAALLISVDGCDLYTKILPLVFRSAQSPEPGKRGYSRMVAWPKFVIARVIKSRAHKRLKEVRREIYQGTSEELAERMAASKGGKVINTAYIERLNATFRARIASLGRRTRSLSRLPERLESWVYLVGTAYNFCKPHASLSGIGQQISPAMAAGLTDHIWSTAELLSYKKRPKPWRKKWTRPHPQPQPKQALQEVS